MCHLDTWTNLFGEEAPRAAPPSGGGRDYADPNQA